jgi:hypothetical protein
MQQTGDIGHHRPQLLGQRQVVLERLLKVDRRLLVIPFENEVVVVEHVAQLAGKAFGLEQVTEAQAAARRLVFVGRADAATGGADLGGAARLLPCDGRAPHA